VGTQLTFDEATHTYRVDGRIVDSVTQHLSRVFSDVYANIPESVLLRKSQLGVATHKAIELFLLDELDYSTIHPEVLPYFESWFEWWGSRGPRNPEIKSEHQFYCASGDYCGTIDLDVVGLEVMDWKITTNKMPTHGIQIAGYAHARGYKLGSALYLKDDGSMAELVEYDVQKLLPDWLSVLRVSNMMKRFQ
jgi:hypothetical protein